MNEKEQPTINESTENAQDVTQNVADETNQRAENMTETQQSPGTCDDPPTENTGNTNDDSSSITDVMQALLKDDRIGSFIDSLLKDAEQRGYLRGRNEQIEVKMREPGEWQGIAGEPGGSSSTETTILNHLRRSVWED